MAGLKRVIYGLPLLSGYRAWQARSLSGRLRDHPFGFRFAGLDAFFDPGWEARERPAMFDAIAAADVFIDIGANQGVYSCYAASRHKHVCAVEPEPNNLHLLLTNLDANGFAAEVYPVALSGTFGTASLYGANDTASLMRGWEGVPDHFRQRVPVNTVDRLFADRWPDERIFIKLDVEGFELNVLRGASAMLRKPHRPCWCIETMPRRYDPQRSANPDFVQVFELMFAAGYRCLVADADRAPVTIETVRDWAGRPAYDPALPTNFIFA